MFRQRGGYTMEAEIGRVLKGLGVAEEDWGKPCEQFSGGWQMRIALAKLLLQKPNLLLLDEPTAGMSPDETQATAQLIRRLGADISVVLVEHDMEVVMGVADLVTAFHQGRIIAEGRPDEIRADDEVQRVYLRGH